MQQYKKRLSYQIEQLFLRKQQRWKTLSQRYARNPLPYYISQQQQNLSHIEQRLSHLGEKLLLKDQRRFQELCTKLDGLSPLKILSRGYSITQTESGNILTNINQINVGEQVVTQLKTGKIISKVIELK